MGSKGSRRVRFDAGAEAFLRHCGSEKGLSQKTLGAYRSDLRWFWSRLGRRARADISEIGKAEILGLVESLKCGFKPRTARRKVAVFKSFFRFHEREGKIRSSPFNRMQVRIRPPDTIPRCLRPDSVAAIVRRAESRKAPGDDAFLAARLACVVNLLLFTGLRVSELVGLNLGGVDEGGRAIVVLGKGSRERAIPIVDERASAAVRRYLKERSARFVGAGAADGDPFLLGRGGNRMTDQAARAAVKTLARGAGVEERVTPHMFRHTYASLLSGAGVDIRAIQQLLGHRSIVTTQIYAHVSRDDQREIVRKAGMRRRLRPHR